MKMYRLNGIIEMLRLAAGDNNYVGFETNEKGNLEITLKTHRPDWRDEDGHGEAVEVLELTRDEGNY